MNDSIVISLGEQEIKNTGGYTEVVKYMLQCDGRKVFVLDVEGVDDEVHEDNILYVFIVVRGKVRWRSKLLSSFRGALALCDFEPVPKNLMLERKNFKGYRFIDAGFIDF